MDNTEEYVLQVFRRAQAILESEIRPECVPYLQKFGQKITQAVDLRTEVVCLNFIKGFWKAGIAFEYLLARSKHDAEFSLDQFDADVQLLNEAMGRAFSADTFELFAWDDAPRHEREPVSKPALPEPDWNTTPLSVKKSMPGTTTADTFDTPPLTEMLDHPMIQTVRRWADSATVFVHKPVAERAMALAVLKMMATSIVDMARPQNNVVITGTFSEVASIIGTIERKGVTKGQETVRIITQLGTMLSFALNDVGSGIRYMQEISEFIHECNANLFA